MKIWKNVSCVPDLEAKLNIIYNKHINKLVEMYKSLRVLLRTDSVYCCVNFSRTYNYFLGVS
ncbi:hypothetical protein CCAN2_390001 [Capnocytophaga canimorsus]|nr:hypothetical protein CCAN2_390001 [Capnocytophaga canimorsus]